MLQIHLLNKTTRSPTQNLFPVRKVIVLIKVWPDSCLIKVIPLLWSSFRCQMGQRRLNKTGRCNTANKITLTADSSVLDSVPSKVSAVKTASFWSTAQIYSPNTSWKIWPHKPNHWSEFVHFNCWCDRAFERDLQCSGRCGVCVCMSRCVLLLDAVFEVIDTVWSELDRQKKGDKNLVCNSSQNIVIAVCSRSKMKTICKGLIGVYNFTGYSDCKDVLYCDVSDGCCHRLEPWFPAFCDTFPLVFPPKGPLVKKLKYSFNLPFSLDSPERQLFGEVCQFSHMFVSDFTET